MARPDVTILMGSHNGARYLPQQIASFVQQRGVRWRLIVSDDGSCDLTRQIIRGQARDLPIHLIHGPCQGYVANYLHLLAQLPPDTGVVALSDQDDVWLPHKLARALHKMGEGAMPVLYCARSRHCDADMRLGGASRRFRRAPAFRNALVQNIASGHSIVLNAPAAALARQAAIMLRAKGAASFPASHDWFLYQLVTGAGGAVMYDPAVVVHYRQHSTNTIGANSGFAAMVQRGRLLLRGRFADWAHANRQALTATESLLTPSARAELRAFAALQTPRPLARLRGMARLRLWRQSPLSTCALWAVALAGKI